ncbi:Na/Pi cotransporter family protein [Desulfopila sp. IMCC35008]|uniref:Na/Pi cotransporter family protein n=1 Tax=Desulfopila sp. IMCC35008 TaxID=2653858 RepID=UPI0013D73789|nr:Na/Pi cotransporter family protein [Desulfopila sp. IMCC35008]
MLREKRYFETHLSRTFHIILLLVLVVLPFSVYASEPEAQISWEDLFFGLFGGLALFLFGLDQLSEGLKKAAGKSLQRLLSKLTTNRVSGALTGALVTGILNSSSVTTVLVVGFISAGVMSLQQSVGVIMGANIGSTVTAQILAFNIAKYALLPVAVGFFMLFNSNLRDQVRHWGLMILGLGLVFFGMSLMSDAMYPLRSYEPFLDVLQRMEQPMLAILAGALFTGLVQSSAATVGISIAMAAGGLLSLNSGIGLALGANIGTCVTALMAAMGKPPEAVRSAVVHVAFNVAGVLIWLPFIQKLAELAITISPNSVDLAGAAKMAAEVPRQIANANTIFNVINTILFLPFTAFFAWLANKLVKDLPEPAAPITPVYLDEALLEVPAMALGAVRNELTRTAEVVQEMLERFRKTFANAGDAELKALIQMDDKVDILELACVEYLGKVRHYSLTEKESAEHQKLMTSAVTMETLADVIETDLVKLVERARGINYKRSERTRELLKGLYSHVYEALNLVIVAVRDNDVEAARGVLALQSGINRLQQDLLMRKSERLGMGIDMPDALTIARLEVSAADKLVRMYSLCKRIAKAHLDTEG